MPIWALSNTDHLAEGAHGHPEVYSNIVSELSAENRDAILEWMENANAHRSTTE